LQGNVDLTEQKSRIFPVIHK